MPLARVDLHTRWNVFLDEAHVGGRVQHGLVNRHNVIRPKDTGVRQDRHARKAKAIAHGRHLRRQDEVRGFALLKR